ncbi:hypothetical protein Tco_0765406 [Tanacetum coccineum]
MYPRFIQICLDMQRKQLQQHSRTYPVPYLSIKVFNNMKRPIKGYSSQEVDLFPTMLNVSEPSTSPSRITSSPSHSPEPSPSHSHAPSIEHSPEPYIEHSPDHTTAVVSFPSPTQPTQPSPGAEQHIPKPHNSPLHVVHSHGSDEGSLKLIELTNLVTKLSERIEVLEDDLKKTKKKSKKEIEQERLSFVEAIRLQKQMNKEQRAQIARDEEIARQWDKEERQKAMSDAKSTKEIDWNDPSVIRAKRKKSLPRKSTRSTVKRQKMEEDAEKEDLKGYLDIVPREEVAEDV